MENFSELIRLRRSMRKFTPELLTSDEVKLLLRAALMSPTSKGLHSWEFVVVDDAAALQSLSTAKAQGGEFLSGAPLAVVVLGDPAVSDVWIEDASVATTQLLLQAEDLGLGACGFRFATARTPRAAMRKKTCDAYWASRRTCACSISWPSVIKAWSGNLSTRSDCSGRKCTFTAPCCHVSDFLLTKL